MLTTKSISERFLTNSRTIGGIEGRFDTERDNSPVSQACANVTNADDPSMPVHILSIVVIIGDTGDRNQPVLSHEASQRDCLVSRGTTCYFSRMMYCRAYVFHHEVLGLWKRHCLEYKYQGTS